MAADSTTTSAAATAPISVSSHAERASTLLGFVPDAARRVTVVDAQAIAIDQHASDPAIASILDPIAAIADARGWTDQIATAVLFTTADRVDATLLAASSDGAVLEDPGSFSGASSPTSFAPYRAAIDTQVPLSFVHLLDAATSETTTTLADAQAVAGRFDVRGDLLDGELVFHAPDAALFVEAYNVLNRPATQGDDPIEEPIRLDAPVVDGLDQIVVDMAFFLGDAPDEGVSDARNVLKKLIVGMETLEYAEGVGERTELAWLDFVVKSEQYPEEPVPAGSVYIRWEFKDDAAIEAFEQNELPDGFRLAPTRFLESDDPDGEIFFALNLYDAAGGTVVGGARAEWDVFVHGPDGADPNAGVRPRFAVVQALAEEVSAEATNLLTPAEPLSHVLENGQVVSTVARFGDDGEAIPVFESSFPVPVPGEAPVARFTREMAIGNDYIYWGHGVSDRVLYNATTFNHDAHFVDVSQLTFTDLSPWAQYLKPEVKDAVYYDNTLEYVASPMANVVDSQYLDITPEWREELIRFTTNGHQEGLMLTAVEQLFTGSGDPFVGREIVNDTPAAAFHFEILDPAGLEASLELPQGRRLAPVSLFTGEAARHWLTVAIHQFEDAPEGTRAEFIVYTTDDDGRPPSKTIIQLLTERATVDPLLVVTPVGNVDHGRSGDELRTRLDSSEITFDAAMLLDEFTERELHLDWIESGDDTCRIDGICDRYYYDAEALDVPVKIPAEVTLDAFSTPWDSFITPEPEAAFFRDNAQQYAIKPAYNLDVEIDSLPFSGVDDATHTISGTGSLRGRVNDLVDSDYSYTGDARLEGDVFVFAIDQQIDNAIGTAHVFTTGRFDLTTASGTQTVVLCEGSGLLCTGITSGSTNFYTAQNLDRADGETITWEVNAVIDLGGTFGIADSESTIIATESSR